MNQMNSLTRDVSIQGKRYSLEPTKAANETVLPPQSKSNQASEKQHTHSSRPSAYQTHINGDPSTNSSGSSSDYTSLHGLPEHNETTDKSQQSLHDERLHRSPRKANNHLVGNRMHSVSSIEESKKTPIPTVDYTIEPIEIHENLHTGNQLDSKQRAIREEVKRKTAENEQVLINVDEYATDILIYLREREVSSLLCLAAVFHSFLISMSRDPRRITCASKANLPGICEQYSSIGCPKWPMNTNSTPRRFTSLWILSIDFFRECPWRNPSFNWLERPLFT